MKLRPNLSKLTEEQVEEKLDELSWLCIADSVNYKSDFPSFRRAAGSIAMKSGRKVYIKLTVLIFISESSGFNWKTYREAVPTLKALGLEEGTIKQT
jgi:hypothetical protein